MTYGFAGGSSPPLCRWPGGIAMRVITDHLYFYQKYFLSAWHNMTPMQYGYLLVTIAVVGWLCMKSAAR
jgi:hypothetical protein